MHVYDHVKGVIIPFITIGGRTHLAGGSNPTWSKKPLPPTICRHSWRGGVFLMFVSFVLFCFAVLYVCLFVCLVVCFGWFVLVCLFWFVCLFVLVWFDFVWFVCLFVWLFVCLFGNLYLANLNPRHPRKLRWRPKSRIYTHLLYLYIYIYRSRIHVYSSNLQNNNNLHSLYIYIYIAFSWNKVHKKVDKSTCTILYIYIYIILETKVHKQDQAK